MPNIYRLVNPSISGQFESNTSALNAAEAANIMYERMTKTINNSMPEFYFSLQKGNAKTGRLYHFRVLERKRESNDIKFIINSFEDTNPKMESQFIAKIHESTNNHELHGGSEESKDMNDKKNNSKKKKSSNKSYSSSSSDSESSSSNKHSKKKKKKKHKKKYRDSSSSDSSFDTLDLYSTKINKYVTKQILLETYPLYWQYYPQIYNIPRTFLPSFVSDSFPFFEIVYL